MKFFLSYVSINMLFNK